MITREQAKAGPRYRTSYSVSVGNAEVQSFYTKEKNDAFAAGMILMGVTSIIKETLMIPSYRWVSYKD